MSIVRPFEEGDIPVVAALHERVFQPGLHGSKPTAEEYEAYLREVFLRGPWAAGGLHSWVGEGDSGGVSAFLGVLAVPLRMGERVLRAAVCTQFCVDPEQRGLLGLEMIQTSLRLGRGPSVHRRVRRLDGEWCARLR